MMSTGLRRVYDQPVVSGTTGSTGSTGFSAVVLYMRCPYMRIEKNQTNPSKNTLTRYDGFVFEPVETSLNPSNPSKTSKVQLRG